MNKGVCKFCRLKNKPTKRCEHPAYYKEYYTDYPCIELGDKPNKEAPIRKVLICNFDGETYCQTHVISDDKTLYKEIKIGYIYLSPGRFGEVPFAEDEIKNFFK